MLPDLLHARPSEALTPVLETGEKQTHQKSASLLRSAREVQSQTSSCPHVGDTGWQRRGAALAGAEGPWEPVLVGEPEWLPDGGQGSARTAWAVRLRKGEPTAVGHTSKSPSRPHSDGQGHPRPSWSQKQEGKRNRLETCVGALFSTGVPSTEPGPTHLGDGEHPAPAPRRWSITGWHAPPPRPPQAPCTPQDSPEGD